MDKLNLDKLSAKMQELNLSEDDVMTLLERLEIEEIAAIPTPKPVVYNLAGKLLIKNGLYLALKHRVWGILAAPHLAISRLLARDMEDGKIIYNNLEQYLNLLTYQGKKVELAQVEDISCTDFNDYCETAEILKKHGVDCLGWKDLRLKTSAWHLGWCFVERVDATYLFLCTSEPWGVGCYDTSVGYRYTRCSQLTNLSKPARLALWVE